jgi:hypothetical protein
MVSEVSRLQQGAKEPFAFSFSPFQFEITLSFSLDP